MAGSDVTVDARMAKRAAMRRATLHLIGGVALLDTIAMIGYYALIVHAPDRLKWMFTAVWTVLTALVVMVLLRRVKRVRNAPLP